MNELLQKHGCSNVFTMPEGLKELMSDITREVLREQPAKINDFIANYLSVLLVTREHGILAVKILDDLCDCRPSVIDHLREVGFDGDEAAVIAGLIQSEIENFEPTEGKEKLKETQLLKKILTKTHLDEVMAAKVCQVARNAYRDYWYRKQVLEQSLKEEPQEPWQLAAENTLAIYKHTKPSFTELTRATERIQAAYRGYHVRKMLLKHLKPKTPGPKLEHPGPPIDIAASRELDLGPLVNVKVKADAVVAMFEAHTGASLGLRYDPMKTIIHLEDAPSGEVSPRTSHNYVLKHASSDVDKYGSRIQSFVKEVLERKRDNDSDSMAEYRKSQKPHLYKGDLVKDHSPPSSITKKISFAQVPHVVIPSEDDMDDDITEELPEQPGIPFYWTDQDVQEVHFILQGYSKVTDGHNGGDGTSLPSSISSEPAPADMSDLEDVDEALDTPR